MADLDSQPKSIQSLYAWYAEGKLTVNRRYQRKLVWTLVEKQRLIESLMRKYPIPAVLLAERPEGGYEIIDGLQRLYSIVSFIETAFSTIDGSYFNVPQFPTAKERADNGQFTVEPNNPVIGQREVGTILDYTLAVSIMRGSSEEEINDVFGRINTYGHRLSDQERRQAGIQDKFSNLVRELACVYRGDVSRDTLDLSQMPSISIDLPKTKHGYEVRADEVMWVRHGVLLSTDLRDSMDEQCIADIVACIVGQDLIERSKDALDRIYEKGSVENSRIDNALSVHGPERVADEVKYCIDELLKVTATDSPAKLRNIFFAGRTTNAFPALFATVIIAFHEVLVVESKMITDYQGLRGALTRIDQRISTGRGSTTRNERRKNVNAVKGLLREHTVDSDLSGVYENKSVADIEAAIRRSEIELPDYELKQGLLSLGNARSHQPKVLDKIIKTICAIANNGPGTNGLILIGVSDKAADTKKIEKMDSITARVVGSRSIVGVRREMTILDETAEEYFARWKNAIKNSKLSNPLKEAVLAKISYHEYYGLGLISIEIPAQKQVSQLDGQIYARHGDETVLVSDTQSILGIGERFK